MENKELSYGFKYLFPAICFLTNLTQIPAIVDLNLSSPISYGLWAIALVYGIIIIFMYGFDMRILYLMLALLSFVGIQGLMSMIVARNLVSSSLSTGLISSILVAIAGVIFGRFYSEELIMRTMKAYYISMVIVAINIYVKILHGSSFITSSQYAYSSKNSITGIIAVGIIFFIYMNKSEYLLLRIVEYLSLVFTIYIFLGLKSRASIVSLVAVIGLIVVLGSLKRSTKIALILSGVVLILSLVMSESFREILIDNILLTNRSLRNLDDVSSGRVTILKSFFRLIRGHYITGIGDHYLESFYFAAILQHGVFGGTIAILTSISPMLTVFRRNWNSSMIYRLVLYVSLFFLINGLFEGISPVGPGAKTYIMWLLFGISLSAGSRVSLREEYDYSILNKDEFDYDYNMN